MAASARIFVSHAREDGDWCRTFVAALRDLGADVWYDEAYAGETTAAAAIGREIRARPIFVPVVSPAGAASWAARREADFAVDLQAEQPGRIILVVIAAPAAVPESLRAYRRFAGTAGAALAPIEAAAQVAVALGLAPAAALADEPAEADEWEEPAALAAPVWGSTPDEPSEPEGSAAPDEPGETDEWEGMDDQPTAIIAPHAPPPGRAYRPAVPPVPDLPAERQETVIVLFGRSESEAAPADPVGPATAASAGPAEAAAPTTGQDDFGTWRAPSDAPPDAMPDGPPVHVAPDQITAVISPAEPEAPPTAPPSPGAASPAGEPSGIPRWTPAADMPPAIGITPAVMPPAIGITPAGEGEAATREDVVFGGYFPRAIAPHVWEPLLVYVARDSAQALARIAADAEERLKGPRAAPRGVGVPGAAPAPRRMRLTIVPRLRGFRFRPAARSVTWDDDVQLHEFQVQAETAIYGQAANGSVQIFEGPLLRGEVPLSIFVQSPSWGAAEGTEFAGAAARGYRATYPCFARRDHEIARRCQAAARADDPYLREVNALRAGERWEPRVAELIDAADVFQLFWSRAAAQSRQVEQEWRHALELAADRPDFVRPIYWTAEPHPIPPELRPLEFAYLDPGLLGVEANGGIAPKRFDR